VRGGVLNAYICACNRLSRCNFVTMGELPQKKKLLIIIAVPHGTLCNNGILTLVISVSIFAIKKKKKDIASQRRVNFTLRIDFFNAANLTSCSFDFESHLQRDFSPILILSALHRCWSLKSDRAVYLFYFITKIMHASARDTTRRETRGVLRNSGGDN